MSRHSHAKRRLRERLGGISAESVLRQVHKTHGYRTGPTSACAHYITVQGQRVKAIYDWRKRRLVTVIKMKEADDQRRI